MSDRILNTNGQNEIDNDLVFVGAKQNGQYMTGFTDKIFVIDLDKIIFPFDFYTPGKEIVSTKQLTNLGIYEERQSQIDFDNLESSNNFIQKFLYNYKSVTVHEIVYYDHIDFVPANYVTAYVLYYAEYPKIYFDTSETTTVTIDNKQFYEHHLKFNTPYTFGKKWNGYDVASWIFPCYGFDKNNSNINGEYFVHYSELFKHTSSNTVIGTMWYPGVWDATRAFSYEPVIKYKITDDNHPDPVWINQ